MTAKAHFRRAVILGTGLIGGSFALALRKFFPKIRVAGWDRAKVVRQAQKRRAIQDAFSGELAAALKGADLIYVALPIGATLDLLPEILRHAAPSALVTDACSTKARICKRAAEFSSNNPAKVALLLPGHPMAGRELSGIAQADARLFRDTAYALIGNPAAASDPRVSAFLSILKKIGARPLWLDPEQHDHAVALVSHLPQLASVALGTLLHEYSGTGGMPLALAGPGLRDALRLAGSPYEMWRDIVLTNRENLAQALDALVMRLSELSERLASRELQSDFAAANELYKLLRDLK